MIVYYYIVLLKLLISNLRYLKYSTRKRLFIHRRRISKKRVNNSLDL